MIEISLSILMDVSYKHLKIKMFLIKLIIFVIYPPKTILKRLVSDSHVVRGDTDNLIESVSSEFIFQWPGNTWLYELKIILILLTRIFLVGFSIFLLGRVISLSRF